MDGDPLGQAGRHTGLCPPLRTRSPNPEPVPMRESSFALWGLKGFADDVVTQCGTGHRDTPRGRGRVGPWQDHACSGSEARPDGADLLLVEA
jgi:hypothetical protein